MSTFQDIGTKIMDYAFYLNGVYQDVLEAILSVQSTRPEFTCYIQPYKSDKIKNFADNTPTTTNSVTLYASITTDLSHVHYKAEVVGWENKSELDELRLNKLNQHIEQYQPGEGSIYLTNDNGEPCTNLIWVHRLEKLKTPIHVSNFIKISDNKALKERTRAGGWSYVNPIPQWVGSLDESVIDTDLHNNLKLGVATSQNDNSSQRLARLAQANKTPEAVQVISKGFKRNPDVVAEVLYRADGICEECHQPAPFMRASDGTPYLEVHHVKTLADGGNDSVDNAIAVCPNCHRKLHFGIQT